MAGNKRKKSIWEAFCTQNKEVRLVLCKLSSYAYSKQTWHPNAATWTFFLFFSLVQTLLASGIILYIFLPPSDYFTLGGGGAWSWASVKSAEARLWQMEEILTNGRNLTSGRNGFALFSLFPVPDLYGSTSPLPHLLTHRFISFRKFCPLFVTMTLFFTKKYNESYFILLQCFQITRQLLCLSYGI